MFSFFFLKTFTPPQPPGKPITGKGIPTPIGNFSPKTGGQLISQLFLGLCFVKGAKKNLTGAHFLIWLFVFTGLKTNRVLHPTFREPRSVCKKGVSIALKNPILKNKCD